MCAQRTRFAIITTLQQTIFCRLQRKPSWEPEPDEDASQGWVLQLTEVVEWEGKGEKLRAIMKAFLEWVAPEQTDLNEAYKVWVDKKYETKGSDEAESRSRKRKVIDGDEMGMDVRPHQVQRPNDLGADTISLV